MSFHSSAITEDGKLFIFGGKIGEDYDTDARHLKDAQGNTIPRLERGNCCFTLQIGVPSLVNLCKEKIRQDKLEKLKEKDYEFRKNLVQQTGA